MSQQNKTTHNAAASTTTKLHEQAKPATFHDFLGMRPADSLTLLPSKLADPRFAETSPSASVSAGRGPVSSASDLGSGERQVQNHLEGIPFYGQRSDVTGTEISNRIIGSKRSNANAGLLGHDSIDSLHLMKMFRNSQSERQQRSSEDELLLGMQSMKQSSGSLRLQPSATGKTDSSLTKWERSIPMGIGSRVPHSSHGGHHGSFVHQVTPSKFDSNAGSSIFSQAAADEGSRTGIKGPGVLSSINPSASQPEKNSTGVLQNVGSLKAGSHISDPESSNPASRQRSTSVTRQMTIFYAGQAHVFDDVHPNKADVIMALAGSNGGSWSTTFASKSASKMNNETISPSFGLHSAANMAFSREILTRASTTGQGTGFGDRISVPTGVVTKDVRNFIQTVEPGVKEKR